MKIIEIIKDKLATTQIGKKFQMTDLYRKFTEIYFSNNFDSSNKLNEISESKIKISKTVNKKLS